MITKQLHKQTMFFIYSLITVLFILLILFKHKQFPFNKVKFNEPVINFSSGTIQSGDVLYEILNNYNINLNEISKLITALNTKYTTRRIQPGEVYEIYYTTFGLVNKFNYWISPVEYFSVVKSTADQKFYCKKHKVKSEEMLTTVSGKISSSVYESMVNQGISPEVIMKFADIFAWQIDFLTDVRAGDTFKFVYKQYKYENEIVVDGEILVAEYIGKVVNKNTAIYFKSSDEKYRGYYTPGGESLRKLFLRAPLNFRRISSYFTYKRFHPILKYWRPHYGIDYVAPIGTPVVSIGKGKVSFAGWKGGYGKVVIIRHNSVYKTLYGHLSKFAKKIRSGKRVKQGELIGYVGSTGLSTGPHLHFEIHRYGKPVNFFKLKFPAAEKIPKKYFEEFKATKEHLIKLLESTNIVHASKKM